MEKPKVKRSFRVSGQICWALERPGFPVQYVYTLEKITVERDAAPDKGYFIYALKNAIEKGRETPKPGIFHTAELLGVYGEIEYNQLTGEPLNEDGETQTGGDGI
jgi:hypothetical protein